MKGFTTIKGCMGIAVRDELTNEWKIWGVKEQNEYSSGTGLVLDIISPIFFGYGLCIAFGNFYPLFCPLRAKV